MARPGRYFVEGQALQVIQRSNGRNPVSSPVLTRPRSAGETVDLARRLDAHHVPYDEFVIPNEIHRFLRHASWPQADEATAAHLAKELGVR